MFQIGEYVVHGNDGICEVKDITQLELPGGSSKRQYYLLVPQRKRTDGFTVRWKAAKSRRAKSLQSRRQTR